MRRTWYSRSTVGSSTHACSGFHSRSGVRSRRFHGRYTGGAGADLVHQRAQLIGRRFGRGVNGISPATCIICSRDSP